MNLWVLVATVLGIPFAIGALLVRLPDHRALTRWLVRGLVLGSIGALGLLYLNLWNPLLGTLSGLLGLWLMLIGTLTNRAGAYAGTSIFIILLGIAIGTLGGAHVVAGSQLLSFGRWWSPGGTAALALGIVSIVWGGSCLLGWLLSRQHTEIEHQHVWLNG